MLRRLGNFLSKAFRSRFAWLFVCLHASWFLVAIANMSPPSRALGSFLDSGGWSSAALLAGRPLHYHYESILLKGLFLLDLPSLLGLMPIALLLSPLAKPFHLGEYDKSYVAAVVWLMASSIQWLLVGRVLQARLESSPQVSRFAERFNRYIPVAIALVVVCTTVATPLINARSRRLGFRHGGISFISPPRSGEQENSRSNPSTKAPRATDPEKTPRP